MLSGAEYREFVQYMKALKLKTMHIKDSLEEIAKLFSGLVNIDKLKE